MAAKKYIAPKIIPVMEDEFENVQLNIDFMMSASGNDFDIDDKEDEDPDRPSGGKYPKIKGRVVYGFNETL